MPLDLDFINQIINIQWGGKQFLYSGADGMWTSSDGEQWTKLDNSVAATSLAFVDGVWVAVNETDKDKVWLSTDNAITWKSISIASDMTFTCAAAMKPKEKDTAGNPVPGFLAVLAYGPGGYPVYTSNDGGKTWTKVFTLNDDQAEGIPGGHDLSGCGGAFFLAAKQIQNKVIVIPPFGDTHYIAYSNGMLYVSTNGTSFSGGMVWGPGDAGWDPSMGFWSLQYATGGVGYDDKAQQFCLTGLKKDGRSGENHSLMCKTSSDPNFSSGDGTTITTSPNTLPLSGGFPVAGGRSESGEFATGYWIEKDLSADVTDYDIYATFVSGAKTLLKNVPSDFRSYPFSNMNFTNGAFGAVITAKNLSQIYIASPGGSFHLTHSGSPIVWDTDNVAAALAVGSVSRQGTPV